MKQATFKINYGATGFIGTTSNAVAATSLTKNQTDTLHMAIKGEFMNQNEIINEEPLLTPEPFFNANPQTLKAVRDEYIRLYGPIAGTARLQTMSKADVEVAAAEITGQARVKDPATRNSSHVCNECDEEPLVMPSPCWK